MNRSLLPAILFGLGISSQVFAVADADCELPDIHRMQHGFVLAPDDSTAVHLVAGGHHGRQVIVSGELEIPDTQANQRYLELRAKKNHSHYFLLQAQDLELRCVKGRGILRGHITMQARGEYTPDAVVIENASFRITRVHLNLNNPFFN